MAEEITQRLGFDASQAIDELRKLQTQLDKFKQGLQSTSGALRKFPTKATPAIQALKQLAIEADKARIAMQGLGQTGVVPGKVSASAKDAAASMTSLGQQAQAAGQKVQTATVDSFNKSSQAAKNLGTATKQAGQVTQQAANTTAAAAGKTAKALKTTGEAGTQAAKSITLSWTTMARVVKTQILIRALSHLVSTFMEAQTAAADFSVSIGEVSTISTGALGSIDQISDSVLELSRSLGLAADEVAEGLYQTLSNQVVDAAEALRFEEQAAKLSIATHSQLKESVNALSSVMNSYNLDVSEVERVSDVLFKTIELGRLRMGEFGDVLGRVTPLTATLGIRYEEMAAAMAALTQKGVPAHTAITQLTQVSQKLLRPTEKLKDLYHEWGVETGPEAIRRFGGLRGVLLKMKDATAGNDAEFSNLLGRVRALVGSLNLTSNGADALTHALEEMENSAGASAKAFQTMEETTGRRAIKAWNDLKVSVLDFGETLLQLTTPLIEALNVLVKNFDVLAIVMVGVGAGALLMSGKLALAVGGMTALTGAVTVLKASLLSLWPIALAVGAALATVFIAKGIQESINKTADFTEEHSKQLDELTKKHEESALRITEVTRKEFAERRKITGDYFSALTIDYRKTFEQFEVSSKAVGKVLDSTLSNISSKKQQVLSEIKAAVLNTDSVIKESAKEVEATQAAISNTAFERDLKRMNSRQKLWAKVTRAQNIAADAAKAYAEAGTNEENVKHARQVSHLAETRAKEVLAHAEEMGNYGAIRRAEDALLKVRGARIKAETQFQVDRQSLETSAHKERLLQLEEYGAKVEDIAKKIQELLDPVVSGKIKGPTQLAEDAARIAELMPQLQAALDEAFDVDMYESLGVADTMARLKTGVKDAFEKAQIDYSAAIAGFDAQLNAKAHTADVTIRITNPELLERYTERFGEISPQIDPGKFASQMEIVAEEIAREFTTITNEMDELIAKTGVFADQAVDIAKDNRFQKWWEGAGSAAKSTFKEIEEGYFGSERRSKDRQAAIEGELTAGEDLLAQVISVSKGLRQASDEGRRLTQTEVTSINNMTKLAKATRASGELTAKQFNLFAGAYSLILKGSVANSEAMDLLEKRTEEVGDGAYAAALQTVEGQQTSAEAQAKVSGEAEKTTSGLEGANKAAAELPAIAKQGQDALAAETAQATQLKTELQGAAQAQKELNQLQSQAPAPLTAPATGVTAPATTEKTGVDLEASAISATKLNNELAVVDQTVKTIEIDLAKLPHTMLSVGQASAQLPNNLERTVTPTGQLVLSFKEVKEQINAGAGAVGNLSTATGIVKTRADEATTATANLTTGLNNATTAGYNLVKAMQAAAEAAAAAARAAAAASSASAGGAYYGGPAVRYRQSGGFAPRGQDRIPVMASAGEFFVNARNARRFSSELQAMNAGSQPTYRDHGGSVTNIGDINVSMAQGEEANQTARNIMTAIRRELRRGTSRLD